MEICLCGKSFSEKMSCSRHQSTCAVYRESLKKEIPKFIEEGYDFVQCPYCGFRGRDLTQHLTSSIPSHKSLEEFRKEFPEKKLICSEVDVLRKKTCEKRYENKNYRNRELQIKSLRKAFSNPEILNKIKKTKLKKYGDEYYVNAEQRKRTMLEKYGVDNAMKCEEFKNKAKESQKKLHKDIPPIRPPKIEKEVLIELHHNQKKTLQEIGVIVGSTEAVISYWMHKHGIEVHKKNAIIKYKEYLSTDTIVKEYLEKCKEYQTEFSFHEYGIKCGEKHKLRMKRLFNTKGILHNKLEELKGIISQPDKWEDFLKSISS
jgi:hypothetical protein